MSVVPNRGPDKTFTSLKREIYRQIQGQLICLCHFYCCFQVVDRELENQLSRSNSSALEVTSDCHLPVPDSHN